MLKEIRCDLFREPIVTFHDGLNVVLGDNAASNSIGKSTMLMIIDFAFGGDSYVTVNYDAIETLGHHSFKFCFKFDGDLFYFIRSTDRYRYVSYCDENYKETKEVSLDNFKFFLMGKYRIQLQDISFREIVGLYSRIWGKKNYDIDKPLHNPSEKAATAINRLIKLFDRYSGIKLLESQILEFTEKEKSIEAASKNEFLPKVTRHEYKQYLKDIEDVKNEMDVISNDIFGIKVNYDAIVSKEIIELKTQKVLCYNIKILVLTD
jgi:uncharacterized protein YydD (DUF2326 family)